MARARWGSRAPKPQLQKIPPPSFPAYFVCKEHYAGVEPSSSPVFISRFLGTQNVLTVGRRSFVAFCRSLVDRHVLGRESVDL
jgi:hypothetical protein